MNGQEQNEIALPGDRASIDDLRALLRLRSACARTEPAVLPISLAELAGLVPHLTLAERRRLEMILPRTREEAVAGWVDDTAGERGLAYRRLTDSELSALYALMERLSGAPLLPEEVPVELRSGMPEPAENERWIAAINAMGERFARGGNTVAVVASVTMDLSQLTMPELHALGALEWKLAGSQPEKARPEYASSLQRINATTVTP